MTLRKFFELTTEIEPARGQEGIAQFSAPMPPRTDNLALQAFLNRITGVAVLLKFDAEAFGIDSVFVGVEPIKKGDALTEPGALHDELLYEAMDFTVKFHKKTDTADPFRCEVWGRDATEEDIEASKRREQLGCAAVARPGEEVMCLGSLESGAIAPGALKTLELKRDEAFVARSIRVTEDIAAQFFIRSVSAMVGDREHLLLATTRGDVSAAVFTLDPSPPLRSLESAHLRIQIRNATEQPQRFACDVMGVVA